MRLFRLVIDLFPLSMFMHQLAIEKKADGDKTTDIVMAAFSYAPSAAAQLFYLFMVSGRSGAGPRPMGPVLSSAERDCDRFSLPAGFVLPLTPPLVCQAAA